MEFLQFTSLKEACVESLAHNFDNFLPVWNKDENAVLKNCLQRNFSDALFDKLKGFLRIRHASFLINPHLRKLCLDRFATTDLDEVIKILKSQGEGILDVQLWKIREEDHYSETTLLQLAKSLPISLKSLQLVGIECSSQVLQVVVNKSLEQLSLRGCVSVTNEALEAALANGQQPINHTLKLLDLQHTSVDLMAIVSVLNSCPNLRIILHDSIEFALNLIYRGHVENKNSEIIQKVCKYNLEIMNLTTTDTLEAVHFLCPKIKNLTVRDVMSQRHIDLCKDFSRLEEVVFYFSEPVLLSPFFQTRGYNLKCVTIIGNVVVPVDSLIRFCPNIQYLELSEVTFGSGERIKINPETLSFQKLRELSIIFVDLDEEVQHISTIIACAPNLEVLYLNDVSRGDKYDFVNMIAALGSANLKALEVPLSDINLQLLVKIIKTVPELRSALFIDLTQNDNDDSQIDNEIRQQLGSEVHVIYNDHVTF